MKANKEELYGEWIRRRQSVPVTEGFTAKVMAQINTGHPAASRVLFSRPVQWAAAAAALLLGLFRLSYITRALLIP